ncbi:hypothetical protein ACP4OV_030663 [Aristida adscensionis]
MAEEGVTATREPCCTEKAQENMEFGAGIAAFGASMILAWYFLSPEARGAHNLRYIIPQLLGFACFSSGVALMLLSMNILELPERLVDDVLDKISKGLSLLCSILPVVTLLSPLVEGGHVQIDNEHKAQLEAAFKFISAISNSAIAGLVALVVNYNVTGGSGRIKGAVLVAIFIMFTTSIWGLLSIEIRTKVLEINSIRLQRFIIQGMWFAIIFMLLLLACAVLAEVFAIVEFCMFIAFTPWVFASAVYLFLEHFVHRTRVPRDNIANELLAAQLNWKADRGIKITMWSFMAIIGVFGGFLHGHDKIESLKACIILLTSAFVSGFALTLLTIRPDSISSSLVAATTVLDWTAATTFAAAIFDYRCNGFGFIIILATHVEQHPSS